MTSVVLCSLTRATLMSPGKDKTRVYGYIYIVYTYITMTPENANELNDLENHVRKVIKQLKNWKKEPTLMRY